MTDLWLGIETTAPTGGIALVSGGEVLAEDIFQVMATHSEKLLPGISGMMKRLGIHGGELSGIAVSAGPGSYTGLRIGISTAAGLARGWNTGVVAVDTLRVLAASVSSSLPVLACIRARKDEVFAAVYGSSSPGAAAIVGPGVYTAVAITRRISRIHGITAVGSGRRLVTLPESAMLTGDAPDLPRPSKVALLGSIKVAASGFDRYPVPVYLRDFDQRAVTDVP